ncbi:hypothetical protein [Proteus mirabilis]|uniref:hypothetical protein n=1 Tax=Proteus mirabilis TaxID=584 RepID=UPI0021BB1694|nr:hypothetical protein [Proteus mirabilis]MCT8214242.1 hypothetical protein [Proteus mirabilis]MCZ4570798.1 hypothetical protein [Proteus mirabilis]MCZ4658141.1 hypothetical protein [Proteus mirabilis]MCZ4665640.1 hypothetical protein [Proteus mirabilis]BDR96426.1 hypothetical protein NUITMVP1_03350 [Proteus mirabilis]
MQNINIFIKENVSQIALKGLHIAPDIPEKKLNNAAKSMNLQDTIGSVIALLDTTVFGSGKDGLAFTGEKMVYKPVFESPIVINFSELDKSEYIRNVTTNDKGKEKVIEYTIITRKDGSSFKVENISECNIEKLSEFLNTINSQFDTFEEEDQLVTLSEMPEELKVAYLKVIVNMAYSNDGELDKDGFAQILLLMTRLELSAESRFTLREYSTTGKLENLESLIQTIDKTCISSHNKVIKISLVKDLFSVFMSVNNGQYDNFTFFNDNYNLFNVTDDEVKLIIDALKLDFKMLNDDFNDDALTRGMKELGAKAGAVGVPLAAVYLSGSVVGMSAAGLTSGLATLGLGGVLGFSSMATGIGVAVLLGVGAYKGIKHLTGANELDKTKRRELMLNEVIKQTQATISYLMEDINFITTKLSEAILSYNVQDEKVKQLLQKVKLLTSAGNVLTQKSDSTQSKCFKLKCPAELNHEKLQSLTRDATKQQIYTLIMSFYEEKTIERENGGEAVNVLVLKQDISTIDMEKIAKIFEAIGYFKATDVIKGKLSGIFS